MATCTRTMPSAASPRTPSNSGKRSLPGGGWETYSSEVGGITGLTNAIMPLELQQAMFIAMDPPKHDRLKSLFQRGFTPKRIAEHEDEIRAITKQVLDRLDGVAETNLVESVAQPVVSR